MEAYGQMLLANPDFVARLKADAPMNDANRNTFFAGSAQGDTDYPTLSEAEFWGSTLSAEPANRSGCGPPAAMGTLVVTARCSTPLTPVRSPLRVMAAAVGVFVQGDQTVDALLVAVFSQAQETALGFGDVAHAVITVEADIAQQQASVAPPFVVSVFLRQRPQPFLGLA